MNEVLFVVSLLACMSALLLMYKFFGLYGIYSWIAFASVFANIEVLKTVNCFGLETTLGNALFGTVFLATDIISENYGEKEAKKAVYLGFAVIVVYILLSQIDLAYIPSETDFVQSSFEGIFTLAPRICLGSICAYLFGNMFDVLLYSKLKQAHGNKYLWFRNNICTLTAQLVDNFILHGIAFSGIMSWKQICVLSIDVWIIEAIVSLIDTPFLYLAKYKVRPNA